MDAKDHAVITVLGDQKRFMVPIYQRQYAWGQERWKDFWEDVVAKAEEALEDKPKFKHYMGALIIAPGADGYTVGKTPRSPGRGWSATTNNLPVVSRSNSTCRKPHAAHRHCGECAKLSI